jgi:hypothetical protein
VTACIGRDVTTGDLLLDYCMGGTFLIERIDPESHRTAAGEYARSAYDHAGRGLVVFDTELYGRASS